MAHGKETPRQKMIGMMYLVLLALIALTVQREVLEAFVLVDEGLSKTTLNFAAKNEILYAEFGRAAAENPAKAGPWKNKADEIRRRGEELYEYIQSLKIEIVQAAEGEDTEAVHDGEIHGDKIGKMDDMDTGEFIMVGDNQDGKGNDLRLAFTEFREYCISLIDEDDEYLKESVESSLETEDHVDYEGVLHTWQTEHFAHLPLIAVITMMSKLQGDVRNVESEMLAYLYEQIEGESFKFNKLESTVIPNSNYILMGNDYVARVFLAARDTTSPPQVFIGEYDSVPLPEGAGWDYMMKGSFDSIPIENGKGVYRRPARSLGQKSWGGLIRIKNLDGTYTSKPFKASYMVGAPQAVVSPTKMNVFYLGVENPVDISVGSVPGDKIRVNVTNGVITRDGAGYIVQPNQLGECLVNVSAEIEGRWQNMGSKPFRVKKVPDPIPMVGGQNGGAIAKNVLEIQRVVLAQMPEDFEFDLEYTVTGFTISATSGGFTKRETATSRLITAGQTDILKGLTRGATVYFDDVTAVGPDGIERNLGTVKFTIN